MNLTYECGTCSSSYGVSRMDEDLRLLGVTMRCPVLDCEGNILPVEKPINHPKRLSAKVLYEACMGRGFPEERRCSPEVLHKLLVGGVITAVGLESIAADEDRSIISQMGVRSSDGMVLEIHFAMSNKGATIYKVVERV